MAGLPETISTLSALVIIGGPGKGRRDYLTIHTSTRLGRQLSIVRYSNAQVVHVLECELPQSDLILYRTHC